MQVREVWLLVSISSSEKTIIDPINGKELEESQLFETKTVKIINIDNEDIYVCIKHYIYADFVSNMK